MSAEMVFSVISDFDCIDFCFLSRLFRRSICPTHLFFWKRYRPIHTATPENTITMIVAYTVSSHSLFLFYSVFTSNLFYYLHNFVLF